MNRINDLETPRWWWLLVAFGGAAAAVFYGYRSWSTFATGFNSWWRDGVGAVGFAVGSVFLVSRLLLYCASRLRCTAEQMHEDD